LRLFGDFIPKGENVGPKQACGLSLQVVSRMLTSGFKDMRPKGENVGPKQACGLSLQVVSRMLTSGFKDAYKWFQGYETKGGECEHEDQKGGSLI
jgi:hypothetical protein